MTAPTPLLRLKGSSITRTTPLEEHAMRFFSLILLLGTIPVGRAADLARMPPNTWIPIRYKTEQLAGSREKGMFAPQGWNKLVYDPDGKRVLFYDRWIDKKHGGWTIYGNCLFALDPAAGTLTPVKVDNWSKKDTKQGGYRTFALPENDKEPTPSPRHVYHAFVYASALKSLFICNGANQTILAKDGKLVGHDMCDGAWRLDLRTKKWSRINSPTKAPPNVLDDAMDYCPDTNSLIYAGSNRQIWILDLKTNRWRKAKQSPPTRAACGQTIFYDPTTRRMLIVGGGQLDAWKKGKAKAFYELYIFDPKTETVRKAADCPTAFYSTHMAYDSKHRLFVAVVLFNGKEHPSGMFCYDPKKDKWHEIKPKNAIPPYRSWFGWMKLCYDSHNDCLVGMTGDKFYAFRYVPAK